jgi:hypothetical protein
MRRHCLGIVGVALAVFALAGCGETPSADKGSPDSKGANREQINSLANDMKKNMQEKTYLKKAEEPGKPAGESKEAGESKPAGESKGAGESKPATEPKPATKSE